MTPGQRDPRPTGFGALSWLWWPLVLGLLWPLAGLSLLVWPAPGHEAPGNGHPGGGRQNPPSKTEPRQNWLYGAAIAIVIIHALAACAPANDPDPRCRWPGFRCAMGGRPETLAANPPVTVPVDNPFACPGRASP